MACMGFSIDNAQHARETVPANCVWGLQCHLPVVGHFKYNKITAAASLECTGIASHMHMAGETALQGEIQISYQLLFCHATALFGL
jgi:hypothetical protein